MLTKVSIKVQPESTEEQDTTPCLRRRGFLRLAAAAVGGLMAAPVLAKSSKPEPSRPEPVKTAARNAKTSPASLHQASTSARAPDGKIAARPSSADIRQARSMSERARTAPDGRLVTSRTSRVHEVYKPYLRSHEVYKPNLRSRESLVQRQDARAADTPALQAPIVHTDSKTLSPEVAFRSGDRAISFYATNTGESVQSVFWTPRAGYVPQSIKELSWALRDHHNDEFKLFDERVFDVVYAMQLMMGVSRETHVISGYRSPETNSLLREESRGVAKNSMHIQARAVDLRMPGLSLAMMHRAALSLRAGGVGYYPRSNFVHLDTGPVRSWG